MTSLHVKHRPTDFAQVLGQGHVVRSLEKVVKDKRAHSFIFTGPSGCGKTTLSRILANRFALGVGTAANVIEVDAATNSGADAMRAIVSKVHSRAIGESPVKAIIVDEVHRISAAAWTIMLKPIEEPPSHVYWMLCTTEAAKIPKTIITRCLRYDLKPVSEDDLLKLLDQVAVAEKLEVDDEILEAIAEGSGGSPRQALVYLEECLYAESAGEARQIMRSAGQSKEVGDLCRWLVAGRGHSWAEAIKFVKALEGTDAENIRIVVSNYLGGVLMNTKDDKRAAKLLGILECFTAPYIQSDKLAPLLNSIGLAIGLDGR